MKSLLAVVLMLVIVFVACVESDAACGRRGCGLLGGRFAARVASVFPLRGRFGFQSRTVVRHKVVGHAGGKAYVCEGDVCRPVK